MTQLTVKSVLRLVHRKLLTAIPGIRHKRFTEEEIARFLKSGFQNG